MRRKPRVSTQSLLVLRTYKANPATPNEPDGGLGNPRRACMARRLRAQGDGVHCTPYIGRRTNPIRRTERTQSRCAERTQSGRAERPGGWGLVFETPARGPKI